MELADYWRIFRRRQHIVYVTFGIVAILSIILVGLSTYQAYNVTLMSLEVNQTAPTPAQLAQQVHNLNTVPWDPIVQSLDRSVAVVNNAFTATDRRAFFDEMHDILKKKYGIDKSWQDIQALLDVYPAARNHIYFKVLGAPGDETMDRQIVQTAAAWVQNYVNHVYPTLYPNQPAPHAFVFDPANLQKAAHLTRQLTGFLVRLVGGLVLGLVLAFLWEYLDDYIHDERDAELLLGTRTLAVVPVRDWRGATRAV